MLKSTIVLIVAFVPSIVCAQSYGSADSTATARPAGLGGIDLTLGLDNRLAVSVPAGQSVVFWDRGGKPTEVKESGRVLIRPGSYSVQAGKQFTTCRVWAHGTAPPAAANEMPIVRGQNNHKHCLWHLDAWTPCAIIVTGIGLVAWGAADAS